jgi:hypothetical protein
MEFCEACGAKCRPKLCGQCYSVGYCGAECQRLAWASHKSFCRESAGRSALTLMSCVERGFFTIMGVANASALRRLAQEQPLAAGFLQRVARASRPDINF